MINDTVVLGGDQVLVHQIDGELQLDNVLGGEFGIVTEVQRGELPSYTGATTITPTQYTQILETQYTSVFENITINPIPSNYGLITWNGSTLTVS